MPRVEDRDCIGVLCLRRELRDQRAHAGAIKICAFQDLPAGGLKRLCHRIGIAHSGGRRGRVGVIPVADDQRCVFGLGL